VRDRDLVARVGGDEIAILFGGADEARCAEAVTRLRDAFESAPLLDGFSLSAAVGSATAAAGLSLAEAQRLADERLYAEKSRSSRRGGAGRLTMAQGAPA
jgi:diguanylate cyclase (GGDEF)-like protein